MKPFVFISDPGVRRDGTLLDSNFYNDGVWVRWQRGRPRKMGGYRAMSQLANGPVRSLLVDSRNGVNSVHYFSQWGVQRQQFSASGAGGGLEDRTPFSFSPNPLYTWSQAVMTSSTGGSYSALLACATPDVDQIDSDAGGSVYQGNMATGEPLEIMSDISGPLSVSGGVTVLQPFPFIYGSNGLIRNGNPNDLSAASWTVGGSSLANSANVAGTKFIYGAPVRGGGQSPAGLFWALDALVRVSFVGGDAIWAYDTLAQPTSVLGKKGIVEHDGKFFWPGTDRFLFYNGVVQELPNQMNSNWFFENLNYAARNKVWGTKIPRFGEIWWFYPRGESTECDNAVIYNYVENTWYDAEKVRSAGGQVQLFPFPIWAGAEDGQTSTALPIGFRRQLSAQTNAGSNVLTLLSTTGVVDGWAVAANIGIPPGTTVLSHTGTTVTMSANATVNMPAGTEVAFSSMTSPIPVGATVTGGTSGASGVVLRATATQLNLKNVTGVFASPESLTGTVGAASLIAAPFTQALEAAYQHEFGYDKVVGQDVVALKSSFSSKNFGFAVGQGFQDVPETADVMTVVSRIDPDFKQIGDLKISVSGRSFTTQDMRLLEEQTCEPTDPFVAFQEAQEREVMITVESNSKGGYFEQGQVFVYMGPGDERSSSPMPPSTGEAQ